MVNMSARRGRGRRSAHGSGARACVRCASTNFNVPARCVRVRPSRAIIRLLLLLARVGVVAAAVLRQEQLRHVIWP